VVATSRSIALLTLAVAGVAISARAATADSINLLRPAALTAPVILFDQTHGPWISDDEAAAAIDKDCVAVNDRARDKRTPAFGAVNWRGSHPAFQWAPSAEPAIVYVVCVDHPPTRSGWSGGGMQYSAALSWSAQSSMVFPRNSFTTAVGLAADALPGRTQPIGSPDAGLPWTSTDPPPASWPDEPPRPGESIDPPIDRPFARPLDLPITPPGDLPIPIASISFPPSGRSSGAGGNSSAAAGTLNVPIALAPGEMIPTPEPGTWLLLGTGLAAAWRIARRKQED